MASTREHPPHRVVLMPVWQKANPYLGRLADSLAAQGLDVRFAPLPTGLFGFTRYRLAHRDVDLIHVHWIAGCIARLTRSSSDLLCRVKLVLFQFDALLARVLGLKVAWTIHNYYAHQDFNRRRELRVRRAFLRFAHVAIVHSTPAVERLRELYGAKLDAKVVIVPHGNYDDLYPVAADDPAALRRRRGMGEDELLLLYFGTLRPQKGLLPLRDALATRGGLPDGVRLIIAGNCDDGDRDAYQSAFAGMRGIELDLRYIPDQELIDYLAMADAVLIPFSDTLTSGTAILAMTCARALILPETARVLGVVPSSGALYFESPDDLGALFASLRRDALGAMGAANRLAADELGWDRVARDTISAYERVLHTNPLVPSRRS